VIHVYAFAEGLRSLPPVHGLDGAPLEQLSLDGVTTVFSRRDAPARERIREQALAHGEVVEALMNEAAAVLPVRFGELLADDAALAESVRARTEAVRRGFARVRDCVEVGVRVWSGAPRLDAATGSEYMRRRRAREEERREIVTGLHGALTALARDARIDDRPLHGREQLVAAYLVQRTRLDELRAVVDAFAERHRDLTVVCTGPWAPFSFAQEETQA
jgi:hypothetical protein